MHMPGREKHENFLHVLPTHTNKSPDPVVTASRVSSPTSKFQNHNGRQGLVDTYYSKELGKLCRCIAGWCNYSLTKKQIETKQKAMTNSMCMLEMAGKQKLHETKTDKG